MGNVCTIYHSRYDKIFAHFRSHNKAVVLDKMLFWWQHSKYTFANNPSIWFTRDYETMAHATGVALSTLKTYLADFHKEGFIQRQSKLVSLKQEDGSIKIKKRCFIRFTDKFLALLNIIPSEQPQEENPETSADLYKEADKSSFFAQDCTIEKSDSGLSYIKENKGFSISNSTISNAVAVDKPKDRFSEFAIETEIGDRLSQRDKNYIKGVLRNLEKAKPGLISNPEQAFAEIVFSILNDAQWSGQTENLRHRINIIAKLFRNRTWRTPKGFYNHCAFSQKFIPAGYKSRASTDTNTAEQGDEVTSSDAQKRHELEQDIRTTEAQLRACEMSIHGTQSHLARYKNNFSLEASLSFVAEIQEKRLEERAYLEKLSIQKSKIQTTLSACSSHQQTSQQRLGYLLETTKLIAHEMEILTQAITEYSHESRYTKEQIISMQNDLIKIYEQYHQEQVLLQEASGIFAVAA
ncbi:TPA: hypothetical protein JBF89_13160 [Legionella pneumophila]|nr:hypothetical protein [Legionella pneumophila]HAU0349913.1 hypothetical protein [Legionella pneumophila]HAU0353404.1 hypothetical protein [Legionella pneumophila]HAU0359493.1 hypothetical protein [Legionella pneumophila]HAU0368050.1 hypothetical protein [Legionella pneumophila]